MAQLHSLNAGISSKDADVLSYAQTEDKFYEQVNQNVEYYDGSGLIDFGPMLQVSSSIKLAGQNQITDGLHCVPNRGPQHDSSGNVLSGSELYDNLTGNPIENPEPYQTKGNNFSWGMRSSAGGAGKHNHNFPLFNIRGIKIRYDSTNLKSLNTSGAATINFFHMPAPPDGTNPGSGNAETTDSRRDDMYLEVWHEKISDKDIVYLYGNVQYSRITTPYTSADYGKFDTWGINQIYSRFGPWDNVTRGFGAKWSNLTNKQKKNWLTSEYNNIYVNADGELIQVRYRTRIFRGVGPFRVSSSQNGSSSDSNVQYMSATGVAWLSGNDTFISSRGIGGFQCSAGTTGSNISTDIMVNLYTGSSDEEHPEFQTSSESGVGGLNSVIMTQSASAFSRGWGTPVGSQHGLIGYDDHSVWFGSDASTGTKSGFGYNGQHFSYGICSIHRRNSGAYHPTWNPNGGCRFSDLKSWNETSVVVNSVADCTNPANVDKSGEHGRVGGSSGGTNYLFHDDSYRGAWFNPYMVNKGDVLDFRKYAKTPDTDYIKNEQDTALQATSAYNMAWCVTGNNIIQEGDMMVSKVDVIPITEIDTASLDDSSFPSGQALKLGVNYSSTVFTHVRGNSTSWRRTLHGGRFFSGIQGYLVYGTEVAPFSYQYINGTANIEYYLDKGIADQLGYNGTNPYGPLAAAGVGDNLYVIHLKESDWQTCAPNHNTISGHPKDWPAEWRTNGVHGSPSYLTFPSQRRTTRDAIPAVYNWLKRHSTESTSHITFPAVQRETFAGTVNNTQTSYGLSNGFVPQDVIGKRDALYAGSVGGASGVGENTGYALQQSYTGDGVARTGVSWGTYWINPGTESNNANHVCFAQSVNRVGYDTHSTSLLNQNLAFVHGDAANEWHAERSIPRYNNGTFSKVFGRSVYACRDPDEDDVSSGQSPVFPSTTNDQHYKVTIPSGKEYQKTYNNLLYAQYRFGHSEPVRLWQANEISDTPIIDGLGNICDAALDILFVNTCLTYDVEGKNNNLDYTIRALEILADKVTSDGTPHSTYDASPFTSTHPAAGDHYLMGCGTPSYFTTSSTSGIYYAYRDICIPTKYWVPKSYQSNDQSSSY